MPTPVEPVGAVRGHAPPAPPALTRRIAAAGTEPAAEAAPVFDAAPEPRPQPAAQSVRVEVRMSAGMQTVTIYDVDSGRAIYQAPPEHTRAILDRAVAAPRTAGGARTGRLTG